jgi:hypothetical protein
MACADPAISESCDRETIDDIRWAFSEVSTVPFFQPCLNLVMKKNFGGFGRWFHCKQDRRHWVKA